MPDEDDLLPDVEEAVLARLQAVVGKVRHPALSLSYFAADLDVLPDDEAASGMDEDDRLPEEERESAMLRRAALLVAALDIVDRCMDDFQLLEFENGFPDRDYAEESFVYQRFPVRHRGAYDEAFFRKVLVTAVKVAGDLADPDAGYASCTAEEIIRQAIGQDAMDLCEDAGLARPWADPDEYLLEDTDFEFLYSEDMDGVEDDPGTQAALGIEVSSIGDWFTPFNDGRHVHPLRRDHAGSTKSARSALAAWCCRPAGNPRSRSDRRRRASRIIRARQRGGGPGQAGRYHRGRPLDR